MLEQAGWNRNYTCAAVIYNIHATPMYYMMSSYSYCLNLLCGRVKLFLTMYILFVFACAKPSQWQDMHIFIPADAAPAVASAGPSRQPRSGVQGLIRPQGH
jgi:hypothetical protein